MTDVKRQVSGYAATSHAFQVRWTLGVIGWNSDGIGASAPIAPPTEPRHAAVANGIHRLPRRGLRVVIPLRHIQRVFVKQGGRDADHCRCIDARWSSAVAAAECVVQSVAGFVES